MKRRASQERDEAIARAQADTRREQLLGQLRDRETTNREAPAPPVPDAAPTEPAAESPAEATAEPAAESDPGDPAGEADPGDAEEHVTG